MAERTYRVRRSYGGRDGTQPIYRLTVPPEVAQLIPEDQEFVVRIDDAGLHYIPAEPQAVEPPSWARRGGDWSESRIGWGTREKGSKSRSG